MKFKYVVLLFIGFPILTIASIDLNSNDFILLSQFPKKQTYKPSNFDTSIKFSNVDITEKWMIQTGSWRTIKVEIVQKDTVLQKKIFSWDSLSNSFVFHGYGQDRFLLFPIDLPSGDFEMKIHTSDPIFNYFPKNYNISIGTKSFFEVENNSSFYKMVLVIPILLGFGLYNLLIFFFSKDTSFLIYFFVQGLFASICFVGFAYLPVSIDTNIALDVPVSLLFMAVYLLFALKYLNIVDTEPFWYKITVVYIAVTMLLGIISGILVLNPNLLVFKLISGYTIFVSPNFSLILFGILLSKRLLRKDKLAYGFSAVMLLFLISIAISYLTHLDFLPQSDLTNYAIGLGMLIESMAFSAALAYRLNYLKIELRESYLKIETSTNEKQLIKKELSAKESELIGNMASLNRKNELLNSIKRDIESQEKPVDKRKVLNLINQSLSTEKDWLQFQAQFNTLHRGFTEKLKSSYPMLTQTDIKLCVFIKLNLSTKEISTFLNIQPLSINQSKYRMKKKMKLSEDIEFGEFIRYF